MGGGTATGTVTGRGEGSLRAEDTVLRALDEMQRWGLRRVRVYGGDDELLGELGEEALLTLWSIDPLTRLRDVPSALWDWVGATQLPPNQVEIRAEDRRLGLLTADTLLVRRGA